MTEEERLARDWVTANPGHALQGPAACFLAGYRAAPVGVVDEKTALAILECGLHGGISLCCGYLSGDPVLSLRMRASMDAQVEGAVAVIASSPIYRAILKGE